MSILRAIQKKRTEEPNGELITPLENIVPFDVNGRRPTGRRICIRRYLEDR